MGNEVEKALLRSLLALASAVEMRDPYTGGHLWRVGRFSRMLAEAAGLDRAEIFLASVGGLLHDLGKIGVPDAVLRKPGKLTADEYAVIKTHPALGRDLLLSHPLAELGMDAVYCHHEHFDGRGYPRGLEGERTPLVARIVSVADAFDAMTSTRPYRQGMPIEKALAILQAEKGRQFDSVFVDLAVALHEKQGRLAPVAGHSDEGVKLGTCPHCGPIVVVPRLFRNGQIVVCRNCSSKAVIHRKGDGYELEPSEECGSASAEEMRPRLETEALEEFVEAIPRPRFTFGFRWRR